MNSLRVHPLDVDGIARITEISLGSMTAQSMSYFLTIRSPSEMRLMVNLKGRYPLEGVEGAIIDLPIASRAFESVSPSLRGQALRQGNLEGKVMRDSLAELRERALLLPNPKMEFLYEYRQDLDARLRKGYGDIAGIIDFLDRYDLEIGGDFDSRLSHRQKIRRRLHHELFFTEDDTMLKRRDAMLSSIMKLEAVNFPYGVPASPIVGASTYEQACAEDINDKCQAVAYYSELECASYFIYTKKALKERNVMDMYFDYVERNKRRLNIVNFFELDLHSPPDRRARKEFANFTKRMSEIKEETPGIEFMLLDAGNQSFVAMEAFDFVSTSMTGIDKMVGWSDRRTLGYWFDETSMYAVPPEDHGTIDQSHCPRCAVMVENDFKSGKLNSFRREHRVHDLDRRARELRQAVKSKSVGAHMRRVLSASEFSGFQMMLHSP